MSFEIKERADAQKINALVSGDQTNQRESLVAGIVQKTARDLSLALGGYVVVSAVGNVKERPDPNAGGDSVLLQVNTTIPPKPAVTDAGLEATAGSPRNFPPEASTAATQTADGSPPATQEPVPQPAPPGPFQAALEQSPVAADVSVEPVPSPAPLDASDGVPVTPGEEEAVQAVDPTPGSMEPVSQSPSTSPKSSPESSPETPSASEPISEPQASTSDAGTEAVAEASMPDAEQPEAVSDGSEPAPIRPPF